jgi:ribonuclease HII
VEQLTFGAEPAAGPSGGLAAGPAAATGYEIERELAAAGAGCVAGVDEVGRGAWAGPVTVCAVIVRAGYPGPPAGLTDSKRLSPARRTVIAGQLLDWVEAFAIGEAGPPEIDAAGMTAALRRAAVSALRKLPRRPDAVLLDGSHDYIGHPWPVRCAVRADPPEFAFADNAGYPSPAHQQALAALGPTPQHRLSWSYLDDLPRWRHLRKHRPDIEGQLSLL